MRKVMLPILFAILSVCVAWSGFSCSRQDRDQASQRKSKPELSQKTQDPLVSSKDAAPPQPAPPAVSTRALSLKVLQDKLKGCLGKKECSEELLHLVHLKTITGYVIDQANHDVILVGRTDPSLPPLHLEDFVIALRNEWLKYAKLEGNTYYYSNPGCSIDPDPRVLERLMEIKRQVFAGSSPPGTDRGIEQWHKVCRSSQQVRVLGIPFDCRFAWVMVKADYDMKKLVDGSDSLDIEGFKSLTDMTLDRAKSDIVAGKPVSMPASSLNRFWFYPGENRYLEGDGVVEIESCPVVLLTEAEYVGRRGEVEGSGQVDPKADEFTRNFTAQYAEIAKARPIYQELESLFRFVALAKIIKFKDVSNTAGLDLSLLLDGYSIRPTKVERQLPGRSHVKGFEHRRNLPNGYETITLQLPSCGGVLIEISAVEKDFLREDTNRLSELRSMVLEARPSPQALFWDYPRPKRQVQLERRPGFIQPII